MERTESLITLSAFFQGNITGYKIEQIIFIFYFSYEFFCYPAHISVSSEQ